MAFAQSDTSARVGRGLVIIESSTWVATMTGLALRRASSTARFWTTGTSSRGSSTPRSPRATMMPSNASTISTRFSTACGFSILAMTGTRRPSSSMIAWTSSMSAALRTKDSAMRSAPRRTAQRRSSLSLSDSAGTLTATPGRLRPLLFETGPGTSTRVTTRGPSTSRIRTATRPSSMRMRSPGLQSPGRPEYVVEAISAVPGTSSVVMVKVWPSCSSTSPSTNRPRRIFGPWRSTRTATARPEAWAAARTRWYTSACSEASPWLRLIRATSIPASTRAWIWSADSVAGPMVHTIFALRMVVTLSPESDPARGTFASADVPLGRLSAQRGDVRPDRRAGRRHRHRQVRPAAQVTVHRCRAGPALGDRPHDERLSAAGVPGDEHAGDGRGERLVVCDTPTLVDLDPELLDQALPGHALEADGDEDELGGDDPLGALDRRRGPVGVPHHLDHPQVGHLPLA